MVNAKTKVVDMIRTMQKQRKEGRQIFYDIYTEEEKRRDPDKRDTGLFFFRGERNAPFAVVCAGGRDGIADWRVMKRRLECLQTYGIDTEFHMYPRMPHGFGLGLGTEAEGWFDEAVRFWERNRTGKKAQGE